MKVSYAQVLQSAPALTTLATKPFASGLALKLLDIIDQLNPHLNAIEKFRNSLAEAAGEGDTDEKLAEKFSQYLNSTVVDVDFTPLLPEEVDQAGLAFTVREMASVRFLFAPQRKQ